MTPVVALPLDEVDWPAVDVVDGSVDVPDCCPIVVDIAATVLFVPVVDIVDMDSGCSEDVSVAAAG